MFNIYKKAKPSGILKGLTTILAALLLSSCAGSSSGGGATASTPVTPISYTGATTQAQITSANQGKVYGSSMGNSSPSIAIGAVQATKSGSNGHPIFHSMSKNPVFKTRYSINSNSTAAGLVVQNTVKGAVGGTVSWSGNISQAGAGNLTAVFKKYDDGTEPCDRH